MADAVGLLFPFQQGEDGELPASGSGDPLLGGMLRRILTTEMGERLMRPYYGSKLREFLFEPADDLTQEAVKAECIRAIEESDPDVKVSVLDISTSLEFDANRYPSVIVINIAFESFGQRDVVQVTVSK